MGFGPTINGSQALNQSRSVIGEQRQCLSFILIEQSDVCA